MSSGPPIFDWPSVLSDEDIRHLLAIRAKAEPYLDPPVLPHFTDHSLNHADRVLGLFLKLSGAIRSQESALNRKELITGIAACLLHDIGMHSTLHISSNEITSITPAELLLIREKHGRAARTQIRDSVAPVSKPKEHDLPRWNLGLDQTEELRELAPLIAEVAGNHSGSVELPESLTSYSVQGENIRLRLLVYLVRLADSLDADSRRIRMENLQKWRVSPDSLVHWWQHHYVTSVDIDTKANIKVTMSFPDDLSAPHVDFFVKKVQSYLQREITEGHEIFRKNDFYPELLVASSTDLSDAKYGIPVELSRELDKLITPPSDDDQGDIRNQRDVRTQHDRLMVHWGVRGNPWVDLPVAYGTQEFVSTKNLEYKLKQIEALASSEKGDLRILFGERGGGKSSFLQSVEASLRNRSWPSYHDVGDAGISKISTPQSLHIWLFREIYHDLTQRRRDTEDAPRSADFMNVWGKFQGRKPVILVDNLDRYSEKPEVELIKRFFQLSQGNLQALQHRALVIISASDEWRDLLKANDLSYVGEGAFWHLEPFSAEDIKELIDRRLRISGSDYSRMFSPDAYLLIHKLSQGNPRSALNICSMAYDRAIKNSRECIDTNLIDEVSGGELQKRIIGQIVALGRKLDSCRVFLDGLHKYHSAVERSQVKPESTWQPILRLLNGDVIDHGLLPEDLNPALNRIAQLRSGLGESNAERLYWEIREEGKEFARNLKAAKIDIQDFIHVYQVRPIPPPGGRTDDVLDSAPVGLRREVRDSLEKARDLITVVTIRGSLSPVQVILKSRFALEHLLVAFILSKGKSLPSGYIKDHVEGHFTNAAGLQRTKYPSVLARELKELLRSFQTIHGGWIETYPEIRIVQRKSELYLLRRDGAALLNDDDATEVRGCIKKIYDEIVPLATGITDPLPPKPFQRQASIPQSYRYRRHTSDSPDRNEQKRRR